MVTAVKTKLDHEDIHKFQDFIYRKTGLHFTEAKKKDLERIILQALVKSGHHSPRDYLDFLRKIPRDHHEMKRLINQLTVGETYFFRDENQMAIIKNEILPPIIARRNVSNNRRLRIWSAGCASGEEPYSVAIIVRELIPYARYWNIEILATDINQHLLKKARAARYNSWSFRNTPEEIKKKFFTKDKDNIEYCLVDEIKDMVNFEYLNLVEPACPSLLTRTCDLDLIICRNVAIYFDKKTTEKIVDRFHDCLIDGGWLVMGASDPYITESRFSSREFNGNFVFHKEKTRAKAVNVAKDIKKDKRIEVETKKLSTSLALKYSKTTVIDRKRSAGSQIPKHYAGGMNLYHSRKIDQALAKFYQGFSENDEPARCAYMIAKIEANKGNLQEAKKWCRKAVAVDKLLLEGHFLLSMIYQELEKDEMAIISLKKAIYIDRDFAEGYFCLGTIYKKLGKKELAEKAFKNAVMLLKDKPVTKEIPECEGVTFGKLLKCIKANVKAEV